MSKKEDLVEKTINIASGAGCDVSDFAVDLMRQRESGEPEINREDRNNLIVRNAINQNKKQ